MRCAMHSHIQAMMFSATLRLPSGTTKRFDPLQALCDWNSARLASVMKTATMLGLTEVLDAVIGAPDLCL